MSLIDFTDPTLFGNEAAEDENDAVFRSYVVERPEVRRFLDPNRLIAIIRAYKGEGKSGRPGGFWTPATMFDQRLVDRLTRHAGLAFEVVPG